MQGRGPRPLHPAPSRRRAAAAADHLARACSRSSTWRPATPARALLGSRPSDPATLAAIREQYHPQRPVSWCSTASGCGMRCRAISAARSRGGQLVIVGDPPAAWRHDLSRHRQARSSCSGWASSSAMIAAFRRGPRRVDRARWSWSACSAIKLAGLRHRHLPALSLRRGARLVPHLRRRPRASSTASGISPCRPSRSLCR